MPRRIQRKRTAGWRMPETATYVGRPSKWGNPFKVGEKVDRDSPLWPYLSRALPGIVEYADRLGEDSVTLLKRDLVVKAHAYWLAEQPELIRAVRQDLAGRDLACWCPLPAGDEVDECHARTLIDVANLVVSASDRPSGAEQFPDTLVIDAPEGWGLYCRACNRTLIGASDGGLELWFIVGIAERHTCAAKETT